MHIEKLINKLSDDVIPLFNQMSYINDKMVYYAKSKTKENIDKIEDPIVLDAIILNLEDSLKSMQLILDKQKEVEWTITSFIGKNLWRNVRYGFLISLPFICSFFITFTIDNYSPLFEKLVHNKAAHSVAVIGSFLLESKVFEKLFESWKQNIFKKQLHRDINLLKKSYTDIYQLTTQLKEHLDNNLVPEIFK